MWLGGTLVVLIAWFGSVVHERVEANRRSGSAGFVNYGVPIKTEGIDSLGQPVEVVITSSRIESGRWGEWRWVAGEYGRAARDVLARRSD